MQIDFGTLQRRYDAKINRFASVSAPLKAAHSYLWLFQPAWEYLGIRRRNI